MSHTLTDHAPEVEHLITEDDEPVDNIPSEKQQRLLTEPLYSSWQGPGEGRTFLAAANIGVFYLARNPAIAPDVLLSLDVEIAEDWWTKEHRSYFLWEFGKPPDVVIEIVSNKVGEEDGEKINKYARMRVGYYVIFDPQQLIGKETLRVYLLKGFKYTKHKGNYLPEIKLGLGLWEGDFEKTNNVWLRWTDENGKIIPTGKERADKEREEKDAALRLVEKEREEKEDALGRAERLAARLRELGQDPDQI